MNTLKNMNRPTALALGAILLCVGAIAPWITVFGVISAGPSNFLEVGLVVFGGIGLIILSALTNRFTRPLSIVVGVAILAQVGYVWFHLSEQDTNEYVTPGWGLWLTSAACLYLIASTWIARKQTPMEKYNIRSVTVAPNLED